MREIRVTNSITNRDSRPVESYLYELSRISLVTPEEEAQLAQRVREGDEIALEKLVSANLRFVVSIAKKYQYQGLPLGDLISEGNLGLIQAAKRFDETRGFKFISFAVWWIRQAILEAIGLQSRMIRLPLNQTGAIVKINKATNLLEQQLERSPSLEEIADQSCFPVAKVIDGWLSSSNTWSYDRPMDDEGEDLCLLDRLVAEPEPTNLRDDISATLQILNDQERLVLAHSYGLGGVQELLPPAIAYLVGTSPQTVRNIRDRALKKLRADPALRELLGN